MEDIVKLRPLAATLGLVGLMESYAIAKAVDAEGATQINPNRELMALGMANLTGAFFRTFPAAGGFSRSAVNHQAGANTPLAGILSAGLVAVSLLLFSSAFSYLPTAILASIIMISITRLIDLPYIISLSTVNRIEFAILLITFLTTLFSTLVSGILTGIAISILYLIYQSAYPHIAELGRVKNYHEFRNIKRFNDLEQWPNLIIVRVDSSLSFINIQFLKDYVKNAIEQADDQLDTLDRKSVV